LGVAPLIDGLMFAGFIADKALDSNSIIADLNERGAKVVISQHPRRASARPTPVPSSSPPDRAVELLETVGLGSYADINAG
jgi:hypothetical protein